MPGVMSQITQCLRRSSYPLDCAAFLMREKADTGNFFKKRIDILERKIYTEYMLNELVVIK